MSDSDRVQRWVAAAAAITAARGPEPVIVIQSPTTAESDNSVSVHAAPATGTNDENEPGLMTSDADAAVGTSAPVIQSTSTTESDNSIIDESVPVASTNDESGPGLVAPSDESEVSIEELSEAQINEYLTTNSKSYIHRHFTRNRNRPVGSNTIPLYVANTPNSQQEWDAAEAAARLPTPPPERRRVVSTALPSNFLQLQSDSSEEPEWQAQDTDSDDENNGAGEAAAPAAAPRRRPRQPKKPKKDPFTFTPALERMMALYQPDMTLDPSTIPLLNSCCKHVFKRLVNQASRLCKIVKKKTLTERDIKFAIRLILPKMELGKYAEAEGERAMELYRSNCKRRDGDKA